MKTVLVNKPIHPDAIAILGDEVNLLTPWDKSAQEQIKMLPEVHGIVLCMGLNMGPDEMDRAKRLEVISRHGAGMDNVDVAAATERGIPVTFTPYGPTESTAEHTLLLILGAARRISELDRAVRSGGWSLRNNPEAMGQELKGKALGVVGYGRIGQRVAEMCRDALCMEVHAYDPFLEAEAVCELGAICEESLVDLARRVDVLSVHVPFTTQTHHLISEEVIRALPRGSMLVNASRGPLVDEQALIRALQDGHLSAAGLDVFDPEPPAADNPLMTMDQVVLSPHVGSFTVEGRRNMGLSTVTDVLRVLRGEPAQFLFNPEVLS